MTTGRAKNKPTGGPPDGDIEVNDMAVRIRTQVKESIMEFITNIVLIVGVLAIVASWVVAVRLVKSDKFAGPTTAQQDTVRQDTVRQDALVGANSL